jgi:transposase-like protein
MAHRTRNSKQGAYFANKGKGLDAAIAQIWDGVPVQRCTVHKHRNLLANAPERLHEEITADYTD